MFEFKKYYLDNGEIYLIDLGDEKFNKYIEQDNCLYLEEQYGTHKLGGINCIIYMVKSCKGDKVFESVVYSK